MSEPNLKVMLDVIHETALAADIRVEAAKREVDGKPVLLLKPIGPPNAVAAFKFNLGVNLQEVGIYTRPKFAEDEQ